MTNNTPNLKPVWEAILNIYKEFAAVCERNNIPFFIAYGTLLGAVRHQGFIPWDDDFDVHMKREDYDRFLEIADKELPPYLKIVKWQNTKEYTHTFCKVQDTRKDVYDNVVIESGAIQGQGLYIDIFALDGCPWTIFQKIKEKAQLFFALAWAAYIFRHKRRFSWRGYIGVFIGFFLRPFFKDIRTENDLARLYDGWSRQYSFANSKFCGRYYGASKGWGWCVPVSVFEEIEMLSFHGILMPAPKGWDIYLRAVFGDYMKLPSEEKRVSTHSGEAPWKFGPTGIK